MRLLLCRLALTILILLGAAKTKVVMGSYIAPLITTVEPQGKYIIMQKGNELKLKNTKTCLSQKIKLEDGIKSYSFSPNGKHLIISSENEIRRYTLRRTYKHNGIIEIIGSKRLSVNNSGDIVIMTVSDISKSENELFIWKYNNDKAIKIETGIKYFEPFKIFYNSQAYKIAISGSYTSYISDYSLKNKAAYFSLKTKSNKSAITSNKVMNDKSFPQGSINNSFTDNEILMCSNILNSIGILDFDFNLKQQFEYSLFGVDSNVIVQAISPNKKYMLLYWGGWEGNDFMYYINVVNTETLAVVQKVTLDKHMSNYKSMAVNDKGKVIYVCVEDNSKNRVRLYSISKGKIRKRCKMEQK